MLQVRILFFCIRTWHDRGNDFSKIIYCCGSFCRRYNSRNHHLQITGGSFMKVIMIEKPKFFSGLLRLIFKIKKEPEIT